MDCAEAGDGFLEKIGSSLRSEQKMILEVFLEVHFNIEKCKPLFHAPFRGLCE